MDQSMDQTPIAPSIVLKSIKLYPSFFEKPLRGTEIGIRVDFIVTHHIVGDVSGTLYFQPFYQNYAEYRPNPSGIWKIYVGHAEIDFPWWVDLSIPLVEAILLFLEIPLMPLLLVEEINSLVEVVSNLPNLKTNIESKAKNALKLGTTIGTAVTRTRLPTKQQQPAWSFLDRIMINPDGIDVHISTVAESVRFSNPDSAIYAIASVGYSFDAGHIAPYRLSVELNNDFANLGPDCSVEIIVRRGDNDQEIARSLGPYASNRFISIDHMNSELYFLDTFRVEVRIFLNRVTLSGLLFAANFVITVHDLLNRHHPFVTWRPHWTYYANAGTKYQYKVRFNRPTIHRTAVSARCLAIQRRLSRITTGTPFLEMLYMDNLPIAFDDLINGKHRVCPYCFFGGPTNTKLRPKDDWFR
jgi:hypothetical protein